MNYKNIEFGPTLMRPDTINSEPSLIIKVFRKSKK